MFTPFFLESISCA